MLCLGCLEQGLGFGVWVVRFEILGSEFRAQALGFGVLCSVVWQCDWMDLRAGLGLSVSGLGFGSCGLGFRV